jgi:hypothetical protein
MLSDPVDFAISFAKTKVSFEIDKSAIEAKANLKDKVYMLKVTLNNQYRLLHFWSHYEGVLSSKYKKS